jgi:hypothetical protein
MRVTAILFATVVLASCGDSARTNKTGTFSVTGSFAPTSAIAAQISPQTLSLTTAGGVGCPLAFALSTDFDLVLVPSRHVTFSMDRVTLHLIDGSNVGGAALTFQRPQLTGMFGSTVVDGIRAFRFRPHFGCGITRPRSILADVVLIDSLGNPLNVTASASIT